MVNASDGPGRQKTKQRKSDALGKHLAGLLITDSTHKRHSLIHISCSVMSAPRCNLGLTGRLRPPGIFVPLPPRSTKEGSETIITSSISLSPRFDERSAVFCYIFRSSGAIYENRRDALRSVRNSVIRRQSRAYSNSLDTTDNHRGSPCSTDNVKGIRTVDAMAFKIYSLF
jgi:hypothetical protein